MNKNIGYAIKYHRNKQNMTQAELARGIISISYLSKIESGSSTPPEETINLLYERLGIDTSVNHSKEVQGLSEEWFKYLFYRKLDEAQDIYEKLEIYKNKITDTDLLYLIEIHKLRYFLIQDKRDKSEKQFKRLQSLSASFAPREMYYWEKFSGHFYFSRSSFRQALDHFLEAEKFISYSFFLKEEEQANLFYMIALAASYIKKIYITYDYANKALNFYQRKFFLKQSAECHILLGITFLRTKDYESSLESFTLAESIAKTLDDKNILAIATQNIGNLHSILQDPNEAIKYYKKSYELRCDEFKRVVSVSSLIKEFYKMGNLKDAKYWLEKGLELLSRINKESIHTYEIKVHHQLIDEKENNLEAVILNEVIPYLERIELEFEKASHFELLADFYFKDRKYKLSAEYYNKALSIKNKM